MSKSKSPRSFTWIALILGFNLGWGFYTFKQESKTKSSLSVELGLIEEVASELRVSYVDEEKVESKPLITGALHGMLRRLDPFSAYHTPQESERNEDHLNGHFAGLGILYGLSDEGDVLVRRVYQSSPAERAGLMGGDLITHKDGEPLRGLAVNEISKKLKGPPESELKITFLRGDEKFTEKVVRGYVEVPSLGGLQLLGAKTDVGYLYISKFGERTAEEFNGAIEAFQKKAIKGLIIDLRFNSGGYLKSSIDICSKFLNEGDLIVYTKGRDADKISNFDQTEEALNDLPLIILVNGDSASASEVTAGCLRDYKRAILVGTKTYGKGSVQRVSPLSNGGSIRYTIAKYYTPGGYTIHGQGLEPDVKIELTEDEIKDVYREIASYDTIDAAVPEDKQLNRALELLELEIAKGKKVGPYFGALNHE
jgi:carboxyl-terminal processing protease